MTKAKQIHMNLDSLTVEEKKDRHKGQIKSYYERNKEARKVYNAQYYKKIREAYVASLKLEKDS